MRNLACLGLLLVSLSGTVRGQDQVAALGAEVEAGAAEAISQRFAPDVELAVDGEANSYPRDQARFVLEDYLRRARPAHFTLVRSSALPDSARCIVARCSSSQGPIRVVLLMERQHGKYAIQRMDFSQE